LSLKSKNTEIPVHRPRNISIAIIFRIAIVAYAYVFELIIRKRPTIIFSLEGNFRRKRKAYLSYFADGVMVSDCPLTEDCEGRLTGYLMEGENKLLLVNYRAKDEEKALSLDLSDFINGDKFSYIVKDEEGNTVVEGEIGATGTIEYKGEAGKLYMIEIK
jgi:hypothetical protein